MKLSHPRLHLPFLLVFLLAAPAYAQSAQSDRTRPMFVIADVHPSPHRAFPYLDGGALHGDRYVLRQATLIDLIATAYGLDRNAVQGGPEWLELDRFDIIAKAPSTTSPAQLKLMLRSLLADRFKLVVHEGTAPMPAFILSKGPSKPNLKDATSTGDPGCHDITPCRRPPEAGKSEAPHARARPRSCRGETHQQLTCMPAPEPHARSTTLS